MDDFFSSIINSYVLPANQMLEYVDTEDWVYLIVGTENGHARLHAKPPGTKESFRTISRALGQIPIMSQIPTMNQSSGDLC